MYSAHLSGSILGESISNGKSNLARSSMNENSGAISGNQIVLNNSVYEDEQQPPNIDRRRNTLGNPDPEEEVVVLSPNSLTNKYPIICQICKKGFLREQNLELHKRSHKLPFNLKKKSCIDNKKKVYLCPISTCSRHHTSRALGDISGMKKHFSRKHCPKTLKCPKCSKLYGVQSDMRAHMKNCGTNGYKCDCGSHFQRNTSFNKHKKSCEVMLAVAGIPRASTIHPRLVTSSEDNSANENHFYLSNISSPLDVLPIPAFAPMHNHQLYIPPIQGFPSINGYYNQVTSAGSSQSHTLLKYGPNTTGKSVLFSPFYSRDTSINNTFIGEPHQNLTFNNPTFNGYASLFPTGFLTPQFTSERNDNYTSQANLQRYNLLGTASIDNSEMASLQMNNMMDESSSGGDMMMSTMTQLQMEGVIGDGLFVPGHHYYEPPTRHFLRLSASMSDDYRVAFRGGMNGYNGGSGWVPWMTCVENEQQQFYDFGCGPSTSTSRISSAGLQGRNSQE